MQEFGTGMYKYCYHIIHINAEGEDYEKRKKAVEQAENILFNKIDKINGYSIKMFTHKDLETFLLDFNKFYVIRDPEQYPVTEEQWLRTMGLWAGVYATLKKFLTSEYDVITIFEDDIVLDKNYPEIFDSLIKELPEDWEVFSVNTNPLTLFNFYPNNHVIENKKICHNFHLIGCAAMTFNKKGAKKIIDYVENHKIYVAMDWAFYHPIYGLTLKTYAIRPDIQQPTTLLSGAGSTLLNDEYLL